MRIFAKAERVTRVPGQRQFLWAVLLISGFLFGTVLGQGPINVNETGLHDAESVYGIDGTLFSTPWTNSQIITLQGWGEINSSLYTNVWFNAYGIYSGADTVNLAAIDVSAIGGNAFASQGIAYAVANAYGIFGDEDVVVNNSGNITANALAGNAESTFGTINAYATAYGISANHALINSGTINASTTGGSGEASGQFTFASVYASTYGLYTNGDVINSGDITTSATGGAATSNGAAAFIGAMAQGEAFGIYAYNGVDNSGNLTVLATGGNAMAPSSSADASGDAYGIYNFYGQVNNTGNITVTAAGGTASSQSSETGASAYGIRAYQNVINRGDITVDATTQDDSESQAYGIYIEAEPYGEGPDSEVTNTGTIRAFGDNAYELYIASGTTRIVDTYNVTLDGEPDRASIFVGDGATLELNDATLTVTDVQGDVDGPTQWNTEYQLFEVAGEGVVTGQFGDVQAINPDVTAAYYNQGTANAADDTVALEYAPEAAETLASTAVEKQLVAQGPYAVNHHMTMMLLDSMLEPDESDEESNDESALGQSACQRAGGGFVEPHYSYIEKDNGPMGYQAGTWGASTGYTQCVNSSLLGLNLGYGQANIDYTGDGYSANSEKQDVATGGFSGVTRWKPWILHYGFTGFHGWHEYEGLTGLALQERETASYNSYGGTATVMVGRTFQRKAHVFLPEVGLNWLWVHRQRYTTEATDASWDTTYSAMNDHDIAAEAALHWQSRYLHKKVKITPSASIGIHQLLTDAATDSWQSIDSANPVLVEARQDRTAVTLAGAVVLTKSPIALTLAYDGEYSSDVQEHNFWMRCKLSF